MPTGIYKRPEGFRGYSLGRHHTEEELRKMRGKHRTEAEKQHLREINLGKHLSKKARQKVRIARLGKHLSEKTKQLLRKINLGKPTWNKGLKLPQFSGENSFNWKGGTTSLGQKIRVLPEYLKWRSDVFQRDNWTCQTCRARNGNGKSIILEAHHIKPFQKILKEFLQEYDQFSPYDDAYTLTRLAIKYEPFWDVNGGETLCKKCHDLTKRGRIKKNV